MTVGEMVAERLAEEGLEVTVEPDWTPPPAVVRVMEQIQRGVVSLLPHWVESTAMVIVNSGEIAQAMQALPGVRRLRLEHRPVAVDPSDPLSRRVCRSDRKHWPCPVIETLDFAA